MEDSRVSRRQALLGLGGLSAAGLIDAFGVEPRWLDITTYDVPVAALGRDLEGYKIAQITDAHLTELGAVEEGVVDAVRQQGVNLVGLTGDIVDSEKSFGALRALCSALTGTGARAVATLGNWEHWGRVPIYELRRLYSNLGVQLLVNQQIQVDGIEVSATDDATAGRVDFGSSVVEGMGGARLLLTHSPAVLDEVPLELPRFDVALAGHTHGGQIRLGPAMVPFVPQGSGRFVAGWYETKAGKAYVSRGTGTSVVPARFTCRPEVPILRLVQG